MSIDTATRYIEASRALKDAQAAVDRATKDRDDAQRELNRWADELEQKVGSNITHRSWVVNGFVVLAEFQRRENGPGFTQVKLIEPETR